MAFQPDNLLQNPPIKTKTRQPNLLHVCWGHWPDWAGGILLYGDYVTCKINPLPTETWHIALPFYSLIHHSFNSIRISLLSIFFHAPTNSIFGSSLNLSLLLWFHRIYSDYYPVLMCRTRVIIFPLNLFSHYCFANVLSCLWIMYISSIIHILPGRSKTNLISTYT